MAIPIDPRMVELAQDFMAYRDRILPQFERIKTWFDDHAPEREATVAPHLQVVQTLFNFMELLASRANEPSPSVTMEEMQGLNHQAIHNAFSQIVAQAYAIWSDKKRSGAESEYFLPATEESSVLLRDMHDMKNFCIGNLQNVSHYLSSPAYSQEWRAVWGEADEKQSGLQPVIQTEWHTLGVHEGREGVPLVATTFFYSPRYDAISTAAIADVVTDKLAEMQMGYVHVVLDKRGVTLTVHGHDYLEHEAPLQHLGLPVTFATNEPGNAQLIIAASMMEPEKWRNAGKEHMRADVTASSEEPFLMAEAIRQAMAERGIENPLIWVGGDGKVSALATRQEVTQLKTTEVHEGRPVALIIDDNPYYMELGVKIMQRYLPEAELILLSGTKDAIKKAGELTRGGRKIACIMCDQTLDLRVSSDEELKDPEHMNQGTKLAEALAKGEFAAAFGKVRPHFILTSGYSKREIEDQAMGELVGVDDFSGRSRDRKSQAEDIRTGIEEFAKRAKISFKAPPMQPDFPD